MMNIDEEDMEASPEYEPIDQSMASPDSQSSQPSVKLHMRRVHDSSGSHVEMIHLDDESSLEDSDEEDDDGESDEEDANQYDTSTLDSDSNPVPTQQPFPSSSNINMARMLSALKNNSNITIEEVPQVTPIMSQFQQIPNYAFNRNNFPVTSITPLMTRKRMDPRQAQAFIGDESDSEPDEDDDDDDDDEDDEDDGDEDPRQGILLRRPLDVEIIEIPPSVNLVTDDESNFTNARSGEESNTTNARSNSVSRDGAIIVEADGGLDIPERKIVKRGRPRKIRVDPTENPEDPDDRTRRTQRKRKPTKPFMHEIIVRKNRKRRADELDDTSNSNSRRGGELEPPGPCFLSQDMKQMIVTNSDVTSLMPRKSRGRGRPSTGRARGRPRGSTLKNRMDREAAAALVEEAMDAVINQLDLSPDSTVVDPSITVISTEPRDGRRRRGRGAPRGPRGSRSRGGARRILTARRQRIVKPKPAPVEKESSLQVFEEETRMSSDIKVNLHLQPAQEIEEASNLSSTSTSVTTKMKKFTKIDIDERKPVTAETLFEYKWPQDDRDAELYMLQEQVSEYLGIKSFKRKYPDLTRRIVDMPERDFLRERKIVTETQADLGLTALNSNDVTDIMFNDFPDKYEEFRKATQDKRERELLKQKPLPPPTPVVRDKNAEFYKRALKSASKWNFKFNKERREERSCSFDLQTYTLNIQESKMKILPPEITKIGYYPVTVLPGQYSDNYREYTSAELKYLPLGTVCYGPIHENGIHVPDSEDSDSDSSDSSSSGDSSSSSDDDDDDDSDDDSSSASPGRRSSQRTSSTGLPKSESTDICKSCNGTTIKNKNGVSEILIHCTKCNIPNHPSCLELSMDMLPHIRKYNWQCTECKNCIECNDPADEDKMLFCDLCDRGYHIYCVGLRKVPTGRWHCRVCSLCYSCGATKPSPDDRMAEWHHEFKKGDKGSRHYMHSLCTPCHKLYKKGQYCPTCLKCHQKMDDRSLLECHMCDKWIHRDCAKQKLQTALGYMCEPCDTAFKSKWKPPTPAHMSQQV